MEFIFALIDRMRQELVYNELRNPSEDRRSEFAFGRLHGMLFVLETMQQELEVEAESQAVRQDRQEREF